VAPGGGGLGGISAGVEACGGVLWLVEAEGACVGWPGAGVLKIQTTSAAQ
jgi:hypothetical protein